LLNIISINIAYQKMNKYKIKKIASIVLPLCVAVPYSYYVINYSFTSHNIRKSEIVKAKKEKENN